MVSLDVQLYMFMVLTLTGIVVGILYDFFRTLRDVFKVRGRLASLGDLVFWLVATLFGIAGLILGNWGELRLYVFLALALGLFLYFQLASFAFRDLFGRSLYFLKRMVKGAAALMAGFWGAIAAPLTAVGRSVRLLLHRGEAIRRLPVSILNSVARRLKKFLFRKQ